MRHLTFSPLVAKVVVSTVVSCGWRSVALEGELGEKGLQEGCVGVALLLVLMVVEGG